MVVELLRLHLEFVWFGDRRELERHGKSQRGLLGDTHPSGLVQLDEFLQLGELCAEAIRHVARVRSLLW